MAKEDLKKDLISQIDIIYTLGTKIFLYPLDKTRKTFACYCVLNIIVFAATSHLSFSLCCLDISDWLGMVNFAPYIGATLMCQVKFIKFYTHGHVYDEILNYFKNDLWDLIPIQEDDNVQSVNKYTNISKIASKFVSYLTVALMAIVGSMPYLVMMFENKILGSELRYLYPLDCVFPFDKITWFYVAYIWEASLTTLVISIYGFYNILHLSIIAFFCMELQILGNCLQNLITDEDIGNIISKTKLKETHHRIRMMMRFIISKYDYLARMSSMLDNVLGEVMILSYSFGSIFICLTAFSFTVVDDLLRSVRYFSFFLALLLDISYQCIIGQVLGDHSSDLTINIYSSQWIYADEATKGTLLMLLLRTQKPFRLTAKGYLTMNLNTLSRICRTSYQFFNLLLTVYEP